MPENSPIGCATNTGGNHNFQPLNGETIFCTQCGIWANVVAMANGDTGRGLTE